MYFEDTQRQLNSRCVLWLLYKKVAELCNEQVEQSHMSIGHTVQKLLQITHFSWFRDVRLVQ